MTAEDRLQRITHINTCTFGDSPVITAVWPSPASHDSCFANAGFRDFDDLDDKWDEEFALIIQRAIELVGEPVRILDDVAAVRSERFLWFFSRQVPVPLDLTQKALLAMQDDLFGKFVIGNEDSGLRLTASCDHELLVFQSPKPLDIPNAFSNLAPVREFPLSKDLVLFHLGD